VELLKQLGADIVIDYRRQRFEDEVRDYDLALDTCGGAIRNRTFGCLKRLGTLISIAGTPSDVYARAQGLPKPIVWILAALNYPTKRLARTHGIHYEYMVMQASGTQLTQIAELLDTQKIRPLVDKVFKLRDIRAAFEYLEAGHAVGKVVIEME
jgi:NADPH:quinone reductase-like Zn-dependent oxidoreductase